MVYRRDNVDADTAVFVDIRRPQHITAVNINCIIIIVIILSTSSSSSSSW